MLIVAVVSVIVFAKSLIWHWCLWSFLLSLNKFHFISFGSLFSNLRRVLLACLTTKGNVDWFSFQFFFRCLHLIFIVNLSFLAIFRFLVVFIAIHHFFYFFFIFASTHASGQCRNFCPIWITCIFEEEKQHFPSCILYVTKTWKFLELKAKLRWYRFLHAPTAQTISQICSIKIISNRFDSIYIWNLFIFRQSISQNSR